MKRFILFLIFSLFQLPLLAQFSNDFFDVDFDNNSGWIGGSGGIILSTSDAGETWTSFITSDIPLDWRGFSIYNEQTVIVDDGTWQVYKTTDGGVTWENFPSNRFKEFYVNENIWFATGVVPFVAKTTNGGFDWVNVYESGDDPYLGGVHFFNPDTGFAIGQWLKKIVRTTNGGMDWQEGDFCPSCNSKSNYGLRFVNNTTGFFIRKYPTDIMKTSDQGNTWQLLPPLPNNIQGYYFIDENNGWICGDNGLMYRTSNGGNSWDPLNSPTSKTLNSIHFLNFNIGVVVGHEGAVYRTTDGGTTWESKNDLPDPVIDSNPPICYLNINNNTATGSATDNLPSEDLNNNGFIDPGEDLNNNGKLDYDSGISGINFKPGSSNLSLTVEPYSPGADSVNYIISLVNPNAAGIGTLIASDIAGNICETNIVLGLNQVSKKSFITKLSGKNVVPPSPTDETGGGMFILNEFQDTLSIYVRIPKIICGLRAALFYIGPPSEGGTSVWEIHSWVQEGDGFFVANIWTASDLLHPLTPQIISELLAGNMYLQVYSGPYAIRGQLTSDQPIELYASMDGLQEAPNPVNTFGSGEGNFVLSGDGTSLQYDVTIQNLSAGISGAHFHNAAFGVAGPVVRGISFSGNNSMGIWANTDAQPLPPKLVADLLGDWVYVNVHTSNYPGGEIRGQIYSTENVNQQFMTVWAATSNIEQTNSTLSSYSLAEGNKFLNIEGEIVGYSGVKNIEDLTIDNGGNFWFLNNSWTSMVYKINPGQIDFDYSTPVTAKQIGRTRTTDDKLVKLTSIKFIKGKLYGLNSQTNKLYEINTADATVSELLELPHLESKTLSFTVAADGNVYILKSKAAGENGTATSELWKFDSFPAGNLSLVTSINSLDMIKSITAHPNGNLYASDSKNLYEINLNEKTIGVLPDHEVDIAGMDFNFFREKNTEAVSTLKFELIEGVTSVEQFSAVPTEYSLKQNYPNPFNPSTKIKFSIPEAGFVKLNVYNSLGEIVETLINENLTAGVYESSFKADGLPSGIYIYKIESGKFTSSSKMILMK